jgi:hypothetical protein
VRNFYWLPFTPPLVASSVLQNDVAAVVIGVPDASGILTGWEAHLEGGDIADAAYRRLTRDYSLLFAMSGARTILRSTSC